MKISRIAPEPGRLGKIVAEFEGGEVIDRPLEGVVLFVIALARGTTLVSNDERDPLAMAIGRALLTTARNNGEPTLGVAEPSFGPAPSSVEPENLRRWLAWAEAGGPDDEPKPALPVDELVEWLRAGGVLGELPILAILDEFASVERDRNAYFVALARVAGAVGWTAGQPMPGHRQIVNKVELLRKKYDALQVEAGNFDTDGFREALSRITHDGIGEAIGEAEASLKGGK